MDTRKLLVFDLDGTLAETAGDLIGTLNFILAREGIAPIDLSQARFMLGAGAKALIQRGYAAHQVPLSPARLQQLFGDFLAHYEAHIADHSFLFPGVVESLDRFEAAGWDFAVCTNKIEAPARKLLLPPGFILRISLQGLVARRRLRREHIFARGTRCAQDLAGKARVRRDVRVERLAGRDVAAKHSVDARLEHRAMLQVSDDVVGRNGESLSHAASCCYWW